MSRHKELAELYNELRNIRALDRIHAYATYIDPVSERAYEIRQRRRKQILHELARLKTSQSDPVKLATVGSAVIFLYAVGYALVHFFK